MARIRTVKPAFFRCIGLYDAEVRLNKENNGPYINLRVAFAGLWTIADRKGRFKWEPRKIKLDCLPYDVVDFEVILQTLCDEGGQPPFIVKYQVDNIVYGYIPGFECHQKIHHTEADSILPPCPSGEIATNSRLDDSSDEQPKQQEKSESKLILNSEDNGYLEIMRVWNKVAHPSLPRCLSLSSKRLIAIKARWHEHPDKTYWTSVISKLNVQGFCLGKNDRGWMANIDYLLRPDSAIKILEGNYLSPQEAATMKKCQRCGIDGRWSVGISKDGKTRLCVTCLADENKKEE